MSSVKYYSATELMERAGSVMIPMENQLPAQRQIASIIAMHLCKIQALSRGASKNEVVSVSAFLAGSTGSGKSYIIHCGGLKNTLQKKGTCAEKLVYVNAIPDVSQRCQ